MASFSGAQRLASFCLVALATACTTTRIVEPANMSNARAQELRPDRAWQLVDAGQAVGHVVLFTAETKSPTPCASFYSVQNVRGQELGMVDVQGRAWRYEVHQREARWLTTGTLLECARAILDAGPAAVLAERALEADAPREPRR